MAAILAFPRSRAVRPVPPSRGLVDPAGTPRGATSQPPPATHPASLPIPLDPEPIQRVLRTLQRLDTLSAQLTDSIAFCRECRAAWESADLATMERTRDALLARMETGRAPS